MLDIFKKIFGKPKSEATRLPSAAEPVPGPATAPAADLEASAAATPPADSTEPNGTTAAQTVVNLPIKLIIPRLPDQVRMKVNLIGASNAAVSIPVPKILEQLAYGSVNVSIDELKQFSPAQVFAHVDGQEQLLVELPIAEILSRLDPSLLQRKSAQKQIEIPPTVTELFGNRGEALPQPLPSAEEEAARLDALKRRAAAPQTPALPARSRASATPTAVPARDGKIGFGENRLDQSLAAVAAVANQPRVAAMTPGVTADASRGSEGESVAIALSAVSAAWPTEVLQDVVQQNLSGATLALPAAKVDEGLRVGHVAFSWKEIRSWLNPAPTVAASPETAETLLEVPLSIIAPLFLPKIKEAPAKKKAFICESIPDVFGKTGEPLPNAAAAVAESPRPIPATPAEAVSVPAARSTLTEPAPVREKAPSSLEDILGKPARKPSNPNDVVQKMVALPGVVGALITLQEGLLVASHWVPGAKPDTLGAFVPQIFSRINQYMREMQLGEIHNATLALDKSTLHVFKSGNLYFAVLGRAGQPLPLPSILTIASELTPQHT